MEVWAKGKKWRKDTVWGVLMRAGMEIYNDNNKLVIDDNYVNLCLTRKVLLTSLPKLDFNVTHYVLDLAENERIFAFSLLPHKTLGLIPYRIGESKWVILPVQGDSSIGHSMQNSDLQGVYVYIFGIQRTAGTDHYGLQVFNQQGEICYDSNQRYMRVVNYHLQKQEKTWSEYPTYSPPKNRNYAIVYTTIGKIYDVIPDGYFGKAHIVTCTIPLWYFDIIVPEKNHNLLYYPDNTFSEYGNHYINGFGYMIIDVTDY